MGAAPQPGFRREGGQPLRGWRLWPPDGGGLCRKVVFADAQGVKVKRLLRLTGLWLLRVTGATSIDHL